MVVLKLTVALFRRLFRLCSYVPHTQTYGRDKKHLSDCNRLTLRDKKDHRLQSCSWLKTPSISLTDRQTHTRSFNLALQHVNS